MKIDNLKQYFLERDSSEYSRSNYDKFIDHKRFSFPIKSIHITGTNGKGSVANFLKNIYKQKYKVGLYVSPFLNDVTEMISIGDKHITEEEYLSLLNEFQKEFDKYDLTSFEIQTYIAYTYFFRNNVDLAIIEVGMGGYIDATNIINPVLSIITSVSLEHTAYLGRSVSEIAESKAGIIKKDSIALVGKLDDSAMFPIREHCKDVGSELYIVDDYHHERIENGQYVFDYYGFKDLRINSLATYELKNASIAVEATKLLKDIIPLEDKDVYEGLKDNLLPCRFEYISENILIDGAHNVEAITELVNSLNNENSRPVHILFAVFRDKNVEQMLVKLSEVSSDITLTTFDHKRARKEEDFFLYLGDYKFVEDYKEAIKTIRETYPDDLLLVTGSLAFVGVVRKYLKEND